MLRENLEGRKVVRVGCLLQTMDQSLTRVAFMDGRGSRSWMDAKNEAKPVSVSSASQKPSLALPVTSPAPRQLVSAINYHLSLVWKLTVILQYVFRPLDGICSTSIEWEGAQCRSATANSAKSTYCTLRHEHPAPCHVPSFSSLLVSQIVEQC